MAKQLLIFVSGPYSADTPEEIQANVDNAVAIGKALMAKGHYVIVPHSMTHNWDLDTDLTWAHFMDNCIEQLLVSDAIFLLPDWRSSKGACIEQAHAVANRKIIFNSLEEVPAVDYHRNC